MSMLRPGADIGARNCWSSNISGMMRGFRRCPAYLETLADVKQAKRLSVMAGSVDLGQMLPSMGPLVDRYSG